MIHFNLQSLFIAIVLVFNFISITHSAPVMDLIERQSSDFIVRQTSGLGTAITHNGSASRKGVSGSCSYTWSQSNSITNVHCTVSDTSCDGHQVYALVRVRTVLTIDVDVGRLNHASGCHVNPIKDGASHSYSPQVVLKSAVVVVCVDDFGPDSCSQSAGSTNPHL
jgi:hypothetical protein